MHSVRERCVTPCDKLGKSVPLHNINELQDPASEESS